MQETSDVKPAALPLLDPAKLLGFRNLPAVMRPGNDIRAASSLAFTKRGTETLA